MQTSSPSGRGSRVSPSNRGSSTSPRLTLRTDSITSPDKQFSQPDLFFLLPAVQYVLITAGFQSFCSVVLICLPKFGVLFNLSSCVTVWVCRTEPRPWLYTQCTVTGEYRVHTRTHVCVWVRRVQPTGFLHSTQRNTLQSMSCCQVQCILFLSKGIHTLLSFSAFPPSHHTTPPSLMFQPKLDSPRCVRSVANSSQNFRPAEPKNFGQCGKISAPFILMTNVWGKM